MTAGRRALASLGALALTATVACGGGAGVERTPVSPGRAAPELTAPSGGPDGSSAEQRSQPWWQPVTAFQGEGTTRTAPFAVDSRALQWRVSWRCRAGTLRIAGRFESGEALRRPIADSPSCPQEGNGFSSRTGRFLLEVSASGPWEAVVEQQVDIPLVEPPLPGLDRARVLRRGTVYGVDKTGRGTVVLYQLADGSRVLRLEDFYVSINSDLEIRLSPLAGPKTTVEAVRAPMRHLAVLKATVGSMNYPIPPDVNTDKVRSIVIWCEETHNAYAAAALKG